MKTRYKILIIGIIIISIILFLWSPSFFGQPECPSIINADGQCRSWSNWNWIYYNIIVREDYPYKQTMASHCPELALRQSLGLDLDKMCL